MERILIQFDSMEQVREFAREIYNSMRDDMQNDSRLLNAKEAAKALGKSVSTLYRYEERGLISSVVNQDGCAKQYRLCDIRWLTNKDK